MISRISNPHQQADSRCRKLRHSFASRSITRATNKILSRFGKIFLLFQEVFFANGSGDTIDYIEPSAGDVASTAPRRAFRSSIAWLSDSLSTLRRTGYRRHDGRALEPEEFTRLLAAARGGKCIQNMSGPDRAMMYMLAAWTGFRKGEIGSLTRSSFDLDGDPPTVTVEAAYSKRRRLDRQVLHPKLVKQLKNWLATKRNLKPHDLLFPVSGRVLGGKERATHLMMQKDLTAARKAWIKEAKTEHQKAERANSDFLCYCDEAGLYADLHSCRQLFITSLERAGVSPRMAQTLAGHSDIRLTMGVYTHIELSD